MISARTMPAVAIATVFQVSRRILASKSGSSTGGKKLPMNSALILMFSASNKTEGRNSVASVKGHSSRNVKIIQNSR